MEKQCDIVQDLLPLHLDGILRKPTAEFVEEHLNNCEPCKKLKNELWKGQIWMHNHPCATKVQLGPIQGEIEFIERVRSWKRRSSVVGILLIFSILFVSWFIGKTFQDDTPQPVIKPTIEKKTSMNHGQHEIR